MRSVQPAAYPLSWLRYSSSSMEAYGAEYFTCRLQCLYPLSKPLLLYLFAYLILPSKLLLAAQNVPTPLPPLSSTPDQQATCLDRVATRAIFTWLLSNIFLLPKSDRTQRTNKCSSANAPASPAAARFKAWVYDGTVVETVGSIPAGGHNPLQTWSGPESSRKLRFPDFMTTAQDGGKVVSLTHRPPLTPGNAPGIHFC